MSHPFGDTVTHLLHRKHGLSLSKLASWDRSAASGGQLDVPRPTTHRPPGPGAGRCHHWLVASAGGPDDPGGGQRALAGRRDGRA